MLKNIHHSRALRLREAFVRLNTFAEKKENPLLGRLKLEMRRNTVDMRREPENIVPERKRGLQSLSPDGQVMQSKEEYLAGF